MVEKWEEQFEQHTLEKGKRHVLNFHVRNLSEEDGKFSTTIPGNVPADVRIKFENNQIKWMRCNCILAKSGKNCEHMAALLYMLEVRELAEEENLTEFDIISQWRTVDEQMKAEGSLSSVRDVKHAYEKHLTQSEKRAKEEKQRRQKEQKKVEVKGKKVQQEGERIQEEKRKKEEQKQEKRRQEEAKREEELRKEEEKKKIERDRKNEERRLRKEARAKAEKERKEIEEKKRQEEFEKRQKEEERREAIRKEKAAEAKRREEKKQQEALSARENQLRAEGGMDAEYELLGEAWSEEAVDEQGGISMDQLAQYHYFDVDAIIESKKVTKKNLKLGTDMLNDGKIKIDSVGSGFDREIGKTIGIVEGTAKTGNKNFPVSIIFDKNKIIETQCGCSKCSDWYGYPRANTATCMYQVALMEYMRAYFSQYNVADATDLTATRFLDSFYRMNHMKDRKQEAENEELKLVPKLILKNGELLISFRFGREKLYVLKNLTEFYHYVQGNVESVYGTNMKIVHNLDNFTELSKEWYYLIQRVAQEHEITMQRMQENYYVDSRNFKIGREMELYGWRLDKVYDLMMKEPIEFENRDAKSKEKSKSVLSCMEKDPRETMFVSPDESEDKKEFLGIVVNTMFPRMFYGTDVAYMINEDHLCKISASYRSATEPMRKNTFANVFMVKIGRNRMAEFYYHVLPNLEQYFRIEEVDADKIHSYLIPDVRFRFYLDSDQKNVACRIKSYYGDREFSTMDYLQTAEENRQTPIPMEACRDGVRENQVLHVVTKYLSAYDREKKILHCNGDEESVYQFMAYGIQELQEMGEVHCTKTFLAMQKVRHLKPQVGLSVSQGILELEISTNDFSPQELVAILRSYKEKKKYYRLKDGSFIGMDEPSIATLADITELLQQKDGKLFKEKIQIPMYRALYLDHLLDENADVYEKRDRYVKQLVKQFHTIKDAEYEVPESLAKTLRKYQKEGYRWLRTLENCGFGGILADEMGLGKTLQTITMLLAAKEEQKEGCSLIVCPASLVYNWEEELHRFAPVLSVVSITGTQEEREKMIQSDAYDVKITSYDLLKRDIAFYTEQRFLYQIIDEAQYIKNHTTAAAKTVKVIQSQHKYALTGTPVENRLSELWSIFDYLMPGFLYSYEEFRKRYEKPIVKDGDEEAMARVQKMIAPFILKRKKTDVLKDLPEKLEEVRYVKLDAKQQLIYDGQVVELKKSLASQDESEVNKNKIQILAALTRMRQICCDPNMLFEDYKGISAKTDACIELIQGAIDGGHRMLVFSQFTSMLAILKERLTKENIEYYEITGSTPKEMRKALVQDFNQGNVPVFLISLKAGGVGLNLTGADMVIHFDPWWNVAAQNQATDRTHRIGQTKKVTVYKLIAKNTIEEKILQLQEKKKELADQILEGESVSIGNMSKEELLDILG